MPETTLKLVYYFVLLIFVLLSIVLTVIQFYKSKKSKKISSTTATGEDNPTETSSTLLGDILNNIPKYMVAAEQFYNALVPNGLQKTGAKKLEDVLQKIKIDCLSNGISYDKQVEEQATTKVEELIELSKNVNSKK